MPINFAPDKIKERICFENPWWETKEIDPHFARMQKREYFHLLHPLVREERVKRAVVLMGPRRVGKTVLLFHVIQKLIDSGVNPRHICYLSIETPLFMGIGLEELLHLYFDLNSTDKNTPAYVFFDEIQYLKDWEIHLKSLVDSYHTIKFIVSGSAAAALKLKSNESGAGRFTEFILPPLTFYEFLKLTESADLVKMVEADNEEGFEYYSPNIKALNRRFLSYLNFGGYPEVSLSEVIQSDPGRYIRNDIIDKVLLRDLPSLYGIQDIQELNSLFTYIAWHSGSEISLDQLSQSSGVSKNTVRKYFTYLEAAFLIKIIPRIDQSGKKFNRSNLFKIYLTNPSLRSALFTPASESDDLFGQLVETAIYSQWNHTHSQPLYYARWKGGEIDIVSLNERQKPSWCIEIKWTNRFFQKPGELKSLHSFCKTHEIRSAVVTTLDTTGVHTTKDGVTYEYLPASLYCYTVGRQIIEGKRY
ncbi:MAG: ATP-binding protein [Bacteroidia bacterium]|jgi:hypothetical protein|nr:ATP-binding protein [Bacteroidia bacterium]